MTKCGRDRFNGFRALKWACQIVFWQIDRNVQDYKFYEKISKHDSKMWAWEFWTLAWAIQIFVMQIGKNLQD